MVAEHPCAVLRSGWSLQALAECAMSAHWQSHRCWWTVVLMARVLRHRPSPLVWFGLVCTCSSCCAVGRTVCNACTWCAWCGPGSRMHGLCSEQAAHLMEKLFRTGAGAFQHASIPCVSCLGPGWKSTPDRTCWHRDGASVSCWYLKLQRKLCVASNLSVVCYEAAPQVPVATSLNGVTSTVCALQR